MATDDVKETEQCAVCDLPANGTDGLCSDCRRAWKREAQMLKLERKGRA